MPRLPAHAIHIADADNWPSIQRDGLMSTDALLRRGAFDPAIEAAARDYRPRGLRLPDGSAIRDHGADGDPLCLQRVENPWRSQGSAKGWRPDAASRTRRLPG